MYAVRTDVSRYTPPSTPIPDGEADPSNAPATSSR